MFFINAYLLGWVFCFCFAFVVSTQKVMLHLARHGGSVFAGVLATLVSVVPIALANLLVAVLLYPAFLLINFVIWLFNDTGLQPLSWFGWAG